MAFTTKKSASAKLLVDYLQEQQEPFMLHAYLAERGCLIKSLSLNGSRDGCCLMNSRKRLSKKQQRSPTSKKIAVVTKSLKSVFQKIVAPRDSTELSGKQDEVVIDERQLNDEYIWQKGSVSNLFSPDSLSSDRSNKEIEYPPSDYENSWVHLGLPESCIKRDYTRLAQELHAASEMGKGKTMTSLCISDLQQAWQLWENHMLDCTNKKAVSPGANHREHKWVLGNQTKQKKKKKWRLLEEHEKIRSMIKTSKKVVPWRILFGSVRSWKYGIGLEFADVFGEWSCWKEGYEEISREIGDAVVDDILHELLCLLL